MTSRWKIYCVRFDVRDHYTVEVKSRSADEAVRKAQKIYDTQGEVALGFELCKGGAENWEAEEIIV